MEPGTPVEKVVHAHGRLQNVGTDVVAEVRQHLSKRYDLDDDYLYSLPDPTRYFSSPAWQVKYSKLLLFYFLGSANVLGKLPLC